MFGERVADGRQPRADRIGDLSVGRIRVVGGVLDDRLLGVAEVAASGRTAGTATAPAAAATAVATSRVDSVAVRGQRIPDEREPRAGLVGDVGVGRLGALGSGGENRLLR